MEIVDKTKGKKEKWRLGDILKADDNHIGIIFQSDDKKYCLVAICEESNNKYSTSYVYGGIRSNTLEKLQNALKNTWHRVNAKLVIE